MSARLTKRDCEIIYDVLQFVLAGENPFDENDGVEDEPEKDGISTAELKVVRDKIGERF